MKAEVFQVEIVEMIKNLEWQNGGEEKLPIMSNQEFTTFLRKYLNNAALSDMACNHMKRQLVNGGFLLDFRTLVVLKPQWLADIFKAIISIKNENVKVSERKGIISLVQLMEHLKLSEEVCKKVLWILEKELSVCVAHPKAVKNEYIIPSLLDKERPEDLDTKWVKAKNGSDCVGRIFNIPFLPTGIFEGILVKCCRISSIIKFWRNGMLLCKDDGESFLLLEMKLHGKSHTHSDQYTISIHATG
jgi:hypothetical protein